MKIGIVSFTERGSRLCSRLVRLLAEETESCVGYVPERFGTLCGDGNIRCREQSLGQWTHDMFRDRSAMVFVGAAGIAVRAIAPFIRDKMEDPPVLVVDESGGFVIPILSGHVGGANELARLIARLACAVPVITTATDVNHCFAVDVFAAGNGLLITDREQARGVSADLLEGKAVGFFSDFSEGIRLPEGFVPELRERNVWITVRDSSAWQDRREEAGREHREAHVLRLVPKAVTAGIGCRRGVTFDVLRQEVQACFQRNQTDLASVKTLATIDIKREEPALNLLAEAYGWERVYYSAGELSAVEGHFRESDFVKQTVGVGNVCERACLAGGGRLIFGRQAGHGVTVAASVGEVRLEIYPCGGEKEAYVQGGPDKARSGPDRIKH